VIDWLKAFWDVVSTGAFWTSPAGAILIGIAAYLVKDWHSKHSARILLLKALKTECESAGRAINDVLPHVEGDIAKTEKIKEALAAGSLDAEVLDDPFSGYCLFSPSLPLVDIVTRLKSKEAQAALEYIDAWSRVTELEKRYAASYLKLVDLTPHLGDKTHSMQLSEVAVMVSGNVKQLHRALLCLERTRKALLKLTIQRLSWKPWVRLGTPHQPSSARKQTTAPSGQLDSILAPFLERSLREVAQGSRESQKPLPREVAQGSRESQKPAESKGSSNDKPDGK
jgi:hypothetical protein